MLRYITRRLIGMLPTLAGVLLITFLLFNGVGGSPAAMTLGQHVSPRMLEDFDEARGYNRPLFWGHWWTTRAFNGNWRPTEAVTATGGSGWELADSTGPVDLPLAFPLEPDRVYRWRFEGASDAGRGTLVLRLDGVTGGAMETTWQTRRRWTTLTQEFRTGSSMGTVRATIRVREGKVGLRSVRLEKRTRHVFDSQFAAYLGKLAHLDLGVSSATNQRVSEMLRSGIGPSLCLTVPILTGSVALGIVLALLCAFYRDTTFDRLIVVTSVALMSVNYLVWIVLGQYGIGYRLGWLPVWGFESWRHLVLPVTIGLFTTLGSNVRFYRTVMLDEMNRDYVRTAFAKGLSKPAVLFRHVLRNALIPIVTSVMISLPFLYTGSLLLEGFFGIPGLGGLSVNALNSADVDVIRAVVLVGACLYMLTNLLTDLCYAWVDPRVRLES